MPLQYNPGSLTEGVMAGGALVPGALIIGYPNGTIGSLVSGQAGQLLSIDEQGTLAWVTVVPGDTGQIPIATGALLGLVRASDPSLPDSVAVTAAGHMTVNNLNVSKLYVAPGDEWVLEGGSATQSIGG